MRAEVGLEIEDLVPIRARVGAVAGKILCPAGRVERITPHCEFRLVRLQFAYQPEKGTSLDSELEIRGPRRDLQDYSGGWVV